MSGFNGSGTYSVVYIFTTDRNDGVKIQAQRMDDQFDDIANALSLCILKDGQQTPTADLPMGGFKLTNLGDATNATDAVNRQTGDGRYHPIGAIVTTDNAIARYNGTVGATQNSGITIDDSNIITIPNTGLHLLDTDASHDLIIKPGSNITADRTLNLVTGDADRTLTLTGNLAMSGAFSLTHTITADTNVTYPTTGTLATLAGSETFTNKTLTAPIIAAISNTGTLTLPTSTDTLVGRDTTDILTNKTLSAAAATGGFTSSITGTTSALISRSTDSGSSAFTGLQLDRNSSTPANADFLSTIDWTGRNDSAGTITLVQAGAQIISTVTGSEAARGVLRAMVAGVKTDIITYGPGVQVGAPAGGDKGAGTLNATALYEGGATLASKYLQVANNLSDITAATARGNLGVTAVLAAINGSTLAKTTNTTLSDVSGLSVNAEAGKTYILDAYISVTADATGGAKAAINGTATLTSLNLNAELIDKTSNAFLDVAGLAGLGSTIGGAGSTALLVRFTGVVVINAAGTITVQFAQNASNGTSTVNVNGYLRLIGIA